MKGAFKQVGKLNATIIKRFRRFSTVEKNLRLLLQAYSLPRPFHENCKFLKLSIQFLGVGKSFRLLMQSCCFFFSRPFHENFKFLKNCPYDFHEILHSHSTPKGAPACAKASKSYGWDVRNIAKISPKMAKEQPFFDFFRFSQKLSIRFERNFLQLFYTILESFMCNGIKIVWLGCKKHSQISPKMAEKQPFFDFFRFSQKLSIRFERNFLQLFYTILESYMCNGIKIVWLGCEKHSQN